MAAELRRATDMGFSLTRAEAGLIDVGNWSVGDVVGGRRGG